MKTKSTHGVRNWGKVIIPVFCAAFLMALTTVGSPSVSTGPGLAKLSLKLTEDKVPLEFSKMMKIHKITMIHAKVLSMGVVIEGEYYFGIADLQVLNEEDVGVQSIVAVMPNNKVERIFELAMARKLEIDAWGWEIERPLGHPEVADFPIYQIFRAKVWDTDLVGIGTPVEG